MIDFHSHLLPGVDDGATDLEQTRDALVLMQDQGIRTVITTPHLSGALTERPDQLAAFLTTLDNAWEEVRRLGVEEFPGLRLERGVEVMLDTTSPDLSDSRIRLAGTSFVLVEFPFMTVPPNASQVIFELKLKGLRPVIAHPERYRNLETLEMVEDWRSVGAVLQVNTGSILGKYGDAARRHAWSLLESGSVAYLSSDYHARGTLHVAAGRQALLDQGAHEQARLLTEENPARLLRDEAPLPVPPIRRRNSVWQRFVRAARGSTMTFVLSAVTACDTAVTMPSATADAGFVTRTYERGTRAYLETISGRDTIRVALDTRWGAGIVELSLNGLNFVNAYDPGREIQLSLYDGDHLYDECAACTGQWGWNPVQAGDRHGNGSLLLDKRLDSDGAYVKIRPIHWSPESNGGWFGAAAPADIVIEQWVAPMREHPRSIRLSYRITHLGDDRHGYTQQQEVPAVYVNREFHRFIHYTGSASWTGGPVVVEQLPQLFLEPQRLSYAAEWWVAFADERNLGLTLFTPGSFPYFRSGLQPGSTGPRGSGALYTHPVTPFAIEPSQVLEGDVYLIVGDYREARKTIYRLMEEISVRDLAAPIVYVDAPKSDSPAAAIEITGWAYDNVSVAEVEVMMGDSVLGRAHLGQLRTEVRRLWPGAPSNAGFRFTAPADRIEHGEGPLRIRARDAAGNSSEVEVAVARGGG